MSAPLKQIGLTGGIVAGKSTVAKMLEASGLVVINLDLLGREILDSDPQVKEEIKKTFGREAIGPSGAVDRQYLRTRVFAVASERQKMEELLHPRIWRDYHEKLEKLAKSGVTKVICEAALLVERGTYRQLNGGLIVVTVPEDLRIQRLVGRDGISEALARQMLAAQLPQSEKLKVATYVIENDGSLEDLQKKVTALLAKLA